MSYIPGSNNGTWGYGMHRALFPKSMGGPLGHRGRPLPNAFQHPAAVVSVPYAGHAFGNSVYALTPGGVTTEPGWGWKFSKKRTKRRSKRQSKRRTKRRSKKSIHQARAKKAMKLKHQKKISLKEAWKLV